MLSKVPQRCTKDAAHLLGRLPQQLRQFYHLGRDPPRLVFGEQLGRRSSVGVGRLSSARMVRRPTIAMGNFVSTVSINRRLTVVRYDNIAGVVTLPGASYREEIKTLRHANSAHFGLRHNALDDLTIIRMVVLRGRFETGRGDCRTRGNRDWDWDYARC